MTTPGTTDLTEEPRELHLDWLPWLRGKGQQLSPMTEDYVREELADLFELDRAPKELNRHELEDTEEDLLKFVRRQIAREMKYYEPEAPNYAAEAPSQSWPPSGERVGVGEWPPQRDRNGTDKLPDLLTPQERAGARAISAYFCAVLGGQTAVRTFRTKVLGPEGTFLSEPEADQFILSPAVRYLSFDDLAHHGVVPARHQAKVVEFETQVVPADRVDSLATIAPVVFASGSASKAHAAFYDAFYVRLHLDPPGEEITRFYLSARNEPPFGGRPQLPWVPFMAQDVWRSTLPGETSGEMFDGSVAYELRQIAEDAAKGSPFESWQVALFLLTNTPPELNSLTVSVAAPLLPVGTVARSGGVTRRVGWGKGASGPRKARAARRFAVARRWHSQVRGSIQITAEPWVSANTIARYWRNCQQGLFAKGMQQRLRLPSESHLGIMTRVFEQYPLGPATQTKGKDSLSLRQALLQAACAETGKSVLEQDYSNLFKAYRKGCIALGLPENMSAVLNLLDERWLWSGTG